MDKKNIKFNKRLGILAGILVVGVAASVGNKVEFGIGTKEYKKAEHIPVLEEGQNADAVASWLQASEIEEHSTTANSIRATMKDTDVSKIVLVNKEHPLAETYSIDLKWLASGREQVASEIYEPLMRMLSDGTDQGLSFVVASGYRSQEYQQKIWDDTIKMWTRQGMSEEEAAHEAAKTLAYPGESEHATGLAVDIVSEKYQLLDDGQNDTEESKWLRENCAQYGFILRYPPNKEDVTGIHYESWHFRYVGSEVAKCIMENGITLEEYLEYAEKELEG